MTMKQRLIWDPSCLTYRIRVIHADTRFFCKQHFYKQRQAWIIKTRPRDRTFAILKLFAFFIHVIIQE